MEPEENDYYVIAEKIDEESDESDAVCLHNMYLTIAIMIAFIPTCIWGGFQWVYINSKAALMSDEADQCILMLLCIFISTVIVVSLIVIALN